MGNSLNTPALMQKPQTHSLTHSGVPDTRGIPEGAGTDNTANSHDFILSLTMINVYFKVPEVIVS